MTTSATPASTMCLDRTTWDLFADAAGNWALAAPPYAIAQDVASAQRTFQGDVYYDQTIGIPYTQQILSGGVPLALLQSAYQSAALTIQGVVQAQTMITGFDPDSGNVSGYTEILDANGQKLGVTLGTLS
jgi:hypothetical protein